MNCRFSVVALIGLSLALSGCALGRGNCNDGSCGAGRCSNCIPPWVPMCKYCPHIDDLVVCETAKNCGICALARYRKNCGTRLSADFAAGFVQAYIDLAEGRGPLPPNLPPSRYWQAYYRSCAGEPKIEQWYAGYNAGLEDGLHGGVSKFRRIQVNPTGNFY